jgi:hypothetical protein
MSKKLKGEKAIEALKTFDEYYLHNKICARKSQNCPRCEALMNRFNKLKQEATA